MGSYFSKPEPYTPSFKGPVELELKPLPNRCTFMTTEYRALLLRWEPVQVRELVRAGVPNVMLGWNLEPKYQTVEKMDWTLAGVRTSPNPGNEWPQWDEIFADSETWYEIDVDEQDIGSTIKCQLLEAFVKEYVNKKKSGPVAEHWIVSCLSEKIMPEGSNGEVNERLDVDGIVILERNVKCECDANETHYVPNDGW